MFTIQPNASPQRLACLRVLDYVEAIWLSIRLGKRLYLHGDLRHYILYNDTLTTTRAGGRGIVRILILPNAIRVR